MTERLSALLRSEADALDIPPVDQAAILGRGHRARTHRRTTVFLAAAAVVAVIGAGTVLAVNGADSPDRDGKATDSVASGGPSRGLLAYGADSTVIVGDATASVPDTLHSLSYTSVGVLTRSNPHDGASDGSGPESLTLIAADGTTTSLGTIPEGVGPATDPDEPVYALAEASGDGFRAVIRDASTGEEVGSVDLPDLPMSYWPVPPLGLDGDIVYAGFKKEAVAFNWRTGETQPAAGVAGGIPDVRGGHALVYAETGISVVDAATGETVVDVSWADGEYGFGRLSPDGGFLSVNMGMGMETPTGIDVYDVASGVKVTLTGDSDDWGWTAGDMAFGVSGTDVTVCNPVTGACESETGPKISVNLRLGGNTYES